MIEHLHVAVAVITNAEHHVLITKRACTAQQGGMWEFPGGKLEPGETPEHALVREIKEELGLTVLQHVFVDQITHDYPARRVLLWVYHVVRYEGNPRCCEAQQDLRWVPLESLSDYALLEASLPIIERIRAYRLCDA